MIGNHKQQPKKHWGTSEELKIAGQHSQRNHCVQTGAVRTGAVCHAVHHAVHISGLGSD